MFGILQHFTFNGKLYWVRELQYGGIPFGPYVNRNHFAGLMELLIPPGLAIQILGGERRDQLPLGDPFHFAADRSLVSVRFPRRNHQLCGGSGLSGDFDCCAPQRKKGVGALPR